MFVRLQARQAPATATQYERAISARSGITVANIAVSEHHQ